MLAHNGLALITEQLQNQKLEDSLLADASHQLQEKQQQPLTLAESSSCTLFPVPPTGAVFHSFVAPSTRQSETTCNEAARNFFSEDWRTTNAQVAICQHSQVWHVCPLCANAPCTPTLPPRKKHCRSLSVPPDGLTVSSSPVGAGTGGSLWRPIPVIPHSKSHDKINHRSVVTMTGGFDPSKFLMKSPAFKQIPSPPSTDSGRFTCSAHLTPSASPVPRPASAASDTTFSSQGSAWQDYSYIRNRMRILENRSLSCEDQISEPCCLSSAGFVQGQVEQSYQSSLSSGGVSGASNNLGIPRCHSQPCVLHHQRCGKKRRHDCDRPTLNFHKMTETAYRLSQQQSRLHQTSFSHEQLLMPVPRHLLPGGEYALARLRTSSTDKSSVTWSLPQAVGGMSVLGDKGPPPVLTAPNHVIKLTSPGLEDRRLEECVNVEEETAEEEDNSKSCDCHDSLPDGRVHFFPPISDLDIEEIENH